MFRFLRSKPSGDSDGELIERFKETGDSDSLARLYERYLALVFGLCLKYLEDATLAEDAVMSIFEELLVKVPHHEIRNFRSWLYTFAKNHCLMQLRREGKNPTVLFDPGFMHSQENLHPMDEPAENGREQVLRECMRTLSPQQRSCIKLFYYEGKSYKEIAEMKCEEVGHIRSYIQNGRRNLRNCIETKEAQENYSQQEKE